MNRILYIWDFAGTLFLEGWDEKQSGLNSYHDYLESKGYDLQNISDRDYEWAYKDAYRKKYHPVKLNEGYAEVLEKTQNNIAFTTGNHEQLDWRAEQINSRVGYDIRDYISEVYSTFDFGDTRKKTVDMLVQILYKKHREGFEEFVYTDDKLDNCKYFHEAARDFPHRVYHILNDKKGVRRQTWYSEIGSLYDIISEENH